MTARFQPQGLYPTLGDHEQRIQGLEASGPATTSVKNIQAIVSSSLVPLTLDDFCPFFVSPDLDGWYITNAQAYLLSTDESVEVEVNIYNRELDVDMLSGNLTFGLDDRCTPTAVEDGLLTSYQLATCQRLSIYPVAVGTEAKGLSVWIEFSQAPRP